MKKIDAWPTWWRTKGEHELRKLVYNEWHPIGLVGVLPEDEYDAYLGPIAHMLRKGASVDDIARHLEDLRIRVIVGESMRNDEVDRRAAELIHAWYARSAPHE